MDKRISEMFTVGGTDVFIYKYLGPKNPNDGDSSAATPVYDELAVTNIQDFLFLENRDREYSEDVFIIRGTYNVQDIDFDLSQFGLFLSNDMLFMTVHINDSVKTVGRKIMAGDVIELPHLLDSHALNDLEYALKRFYVVEDVTRAAEGYSATWYPHLYRMKLKQIYDGQEFADILNRPVSPDDDTTLRDLLSTCSVDMEINRAVLDQAEADAAKSGHNVSHLYTLALNDDGSTDIQTVDANDIDATSGLTADVIYGTPEKLGYTGYLVGIDGAPNGTPFGSGISFPLESTTGSYYLRTDFKPKRLYRFDEVRWVKVTDDVRETLSNTDTRKNQLGTFVNNTTTSTIGGEVVEERQSITDALRPKADEV
jgi:hypothetical protein